MSLAILRVMLLGLLRDRGALVMSFLVPAVFFLIFASIFSASTGQGLRPVVAVADEAQNDQSRRLLESLSAAPELDIAGPMNRPASEVRDWVRRGTVDVGLIVRAGAGPTPFTIVSDPARSFATQILSAQLQRVHFTTSMQSDDSVAEMANQVDFDIATTLFNWEYVAGESADLNSIAYSAGAVAVLFLLLAAVHGAITLFDEQQSGVLERVVAGPGSTVVLVNGKFLYLVLQGFVQVWVIFMVAWLVHGVDLPGHWLSWTLITLTASAAAAGLALAMTTACTSRQQAQSFANIAVLIMSALGGSMVPRFLMPKVLQDVGWLTPNAWALEAYNSVFWRDEPIPALLLPIGLLLSTAIVGLALTQVFARRLRSL